MKVGTDTSPCTTELVFTRDGPDGNGTLSLEEEISTSTSNLKLVLSIYPPLPLFRATSLITITVHLKPGPVSPLFLRV
jgi:hypothetical protein